MKNEPRKIHVLGVGSTGSEFVPGAHATGVHGLFDPERAGQKPLKLTNGPARDVSPTRLQIREAAAGKTMAEAELQNILNLFERAANAEIHRNVPAGEVAVPHDDPRQVLGPMRAYAKRHKLQRPLAITDDGAAHARACPLVAAAGKDNPFLATWHVSPGSPFASVQSRRRQAAYVINGFNGLVLAPDSYVHNPTVGDVIETLGGAGPCFHAGVASAPLATNGNSFWTGARRLVGGRYTRADAPLNDALAQGARASEMALATGSQTTSEEIAVERVVYVLYIVPIEKKGEIFNEFIERMSVWLTRNVPSAKPIFVSGPGIRGIDDEGERFLQVTVLAVMAKPSGKGA